MKSDFRFIRLIPLLALLFASCSKDDTTTGDQSGLAVVSINAETQGKFAGEDILVTATVSNSGSAISSYTWNVSSGSFEPVSDTSILWSTPSQPGNHTVSLTITDSENNTASNSLNVSLESNPNTFERILGPDYVRLSSENQIVRIGQFVYFASGEGINNLMGVAIRLKKFDLTGNLIWTVTLLEDQNASWGNPIMQGTSDSGLIVIANDLIFKLNTEGTVLWSKERDGEIKFVELGNGNYFFIRTLTEGSASRAYYSIVSPSGQVLEEGLIDPGYVVSRISDIEEGPEANTFVTMASVVIPDFPDIKTEIQLINTSGEVLQSYRSTYPFASSQNSTELSRNANGSYSAYYTPSEQNERKIRRVTVDASLNFENEIVYDFAKSHEVFEVIPANGGGHYIIGSFGTSLWTSKSLFFKIDTNGQLIWQREYGDISSIMDFCTGLLELPNGNIMISGSTLVGPVGAGIVKAYLNRYNSNGEL